MREHTHVHHYAIRRLIYFPFDELGRSPISGGMVAVLKDRSAARKLLYELELKAFRQVPLSVLEKLTYDHSGGYWGKCYDLSEYCRREFGIEIAEQQSSPAPYENHRLAPRDGVQVPAEAADDQIWAIKRITGIDFYELFEFTGRKSEWDDFLQLLEEDRPDEGTDEGPRDIYAHLYS